MGSLRQRRGGRRKARVGAFQRINVTPPRTTGQSNPGRTLVLLGKTATANMQPFAAALRKPTGTGRTLKQSQQAWLTTRDATMQAYKLCLKQGNPQQTEDGWFNAHMNLIIIEMTKTRCLILDSTPSKAAIFNSLSPSTHHEHISYFCVSHKHNPLRNRNMRNRYQSARIYRRGGNQAE